MRIRTLVALVAAFATAVGLGVLNAADAATAPAGPFHVVAAPKISGQLLGVSAVTDRDVWTVGQSSDGKPIVQHYNGTSWRSFDVSALAPGYSTLRAVRALGNNNVWAVGGVGDGSSLVLHWNGKQWSRIASPNGTTPSLYSSTVFQQILARSASDIWVVGGWDEGGPTGDSDFVAMAVHWNGSHWTNQSPPRDSTHYFPGFTSVTALSSTTLLAVGNNDGDSCCFISSSALWNGKQWTQPHTPGENGAINAVTAVSSTEAWAVGSYGPNLDPSPLLHWFNGSWHYQRNNFIDLQAVTRRSAKDVWAVGGDLYGSSVIAMHFDGKAWQVVQQGSHKSLTAVTVSPSGRLWAVGLLDSSSGWHTLVMATK
jgi:hypothetical protein